MQTVHVTLVWQLGDGVLVLIATTSKTGASYDDTWSVSPSLALASMTVVEASDASDPNYVSKAAVPGSALAPDTTYTFGYAIVMRLGASVWAGSSSVAVTVGPDGSVTTLGEDSPTP